jgi:hypothetical protein
LNFIRDAAIRLAIVTTNVARFVSFVDVRMWMVFFPMSSSVHLEFIEK